MLESILFMILMFVGAIALIISIVIILIGLIKKENTLRNIGFGIAVIPAICFGLITYWYGIAIPSFNDSQLNDFAGTYKPHKSAISTLKENRLFDKENQLILKADGTYEFDIIQGMGLKKIGKWETGGIDGHFNFYDKSGKLADFGMPSGSGDDCGLSFQFRANEDEFFEVESLYFIKTK